MRLIASFDVPGVVGLPRPRACIRNGKPCLYNPAKGDAQKLAIQTAYRAARTVKEPVSGPVSIQVNSSRPLPKSAPKRRDGEHDTFKPDIDNILKLVLDALNGLAYEDDCQVIEALVTKQPRFIGTEEKTHVRMYALGEGD